MKYKKYILGLAVGLMISTVGAGTAFADFQSWSYTNTATTVTPNSGWVTICNANSAPMEIVSASSGLTVRNLSSYTNLSPISFVGMTAGDYFIQCVGNGFNRFMAITVNSQGGLFLLVPPPPPTPQAVGIGFFKAPTDTGYATSYKSTDMIGQTATALQSTMGINGLGSIVAIIGGLLVAFGIGLMVINMFNETKNINKTKNTGKKI